MFCDRIKGARMSKGLMQKTLAEMLNVKPSTVSMWEAGTRTPDLMMLKKIAEVLDVSYEELLEDKIVEAVFDGKLTPEHLDLIKKKAPGVSRSDLETILNQMDESEIDQMIDYAQYLLSKKAIRFVPEDQSDK